MSGLIASGPSKCHGDGGMVTRMSRAAIAMAASVSHRSCAWMNCSTRSRSSALGSRADHSVLVARRGRLEQQVRIRLQPRHLGMRARGGPARAAPQHVQADVRGNPVQPRAKLRTAVEAGPAAPRLKERLLHRVLGLVE